MDMTKVTLTIETPDSNQAYAITSDRFGKFVLPLVFSCVKSAVADHQHEVQAVTAAMHVLSDFFNITDPAEDVMMNDPQSDKMVTMTEPQRLEQ